MPRSSQARPRLYPVRPNGRIKAISRLLIILLLAGLVIAPFSPSDPFIDHRQPFKWTKSEVKRWTKLLWHTTPKQWKCLDQLNTQESQWSWTMRNSHGGAYGIAQALPPSKYEAISNDWRTNPMTQVVWQKKYIEVRYHDRHGVGIPCYAWKHELRKGWY